MPSLAAPLVDLLKAVASQLIVWHHLAFYGPMSDVVHARLPTLIDALYDHARLAVQVFFVVGGFLAARSLLPRPEAPVTALAPHQFAALVWRRYLRLAVPMAVALAAALAAAAFARALIDEPSTPAAPSLAQLATHLLLLHDLAGHDALSAGLWYVAIDLHLYLLLALVVALRAPAARVGVNPGAFALCACAALTLGSLFWFNRQPDLDIWAPYFFGAYGLGVFAQWISTRPRPSGWALLLGAVVVAALAVEWRSRIGVAGLTAMLLAWGSDRSAWVRAAALLRARALAHISYSVFLIHYPVMLVVGAVVASRWPGSVGMNAAGMLVAWAASLGAGALLHHAVEGRRWLLAASRPAAGSVQ